MLQCLELNVAVSPNSDLWKKSDLRFDVLGFFEIFDLRDLEMTGKHVTTCKHGKNRGSTVQSSINSGLSA